MGAFAWIGQFARDLRFGARSLRQAAAFTAIAIGSLALGIGGSTAMYSVIHAVILDPFPYKDPDRLMSVTVLGQRGGNFSYYRIDQFLEIARRNEVFSGVIASTWSDILWTGAGEPQRLRGNHCTMNTFDVMGVPPLVGRATLASDAVEGAGPVTILGYKFWQRQFGGDPGVLGRKLRLNDKVRTVIGVMPPRFMWRGADVYLPDVLHKGETVEGERSVHLLGRLKPGITREQALAGIRAVLQPVLEDLEQTYPNDFPKPWRIRLQTFGETFPSGIQDALWTLFGAVGLLLLIACVNVSNLLLSRGAYRRREMAIRAAMGAGSFRIVRQLLAESLLLALGGGAAGVLLAYAGLRGIVAVVPPNTIPDEARITLNAPVLGFTLAVSVVVSLLFGLAPALQLAGRDLLAPLREAGRGGFGRGFPAGWPGPGPPTGGPRSADAAQRGRPGRFRRRAAAPDARRPGGGRGGAFRGAAGGGQPDDPHAPLHPGRQSRLSPGPHPDAADSVLRAALPGREAPQRLPAGCPGENADGSGSAGGGHQRGAASGVQLELPGGSGGEFAAGEPAGAGAADQRGLSAGHGTQVGARAFPERSRGGGSAP